MEKKGKKKEGKIGKEEKEDGIKMRYGEDKYVWD